MAVRSGVRQMVSVDSDPIWVQAVREHPEIAPRCADGSVSLLHADIGPVLEWGKPAGTGKIKAWHAYLSAGWTEWARRGEMPDLVFVDGRFRVAACLSVALVASSTHPRSELCVLLHDVSDRRPRYRDVLEFFDEVEMVDTLLVMKLRPNVPPGQILGALLQRQFDSA